MMNTIERLRPILIDTLGLDIVVGPALTSVGSSGLTQETYEIIRDAAVRLCTETGLDTQLLENHASAEVTPHVIRDCLIETLSSTAAYLSHVRLGFLHIDQTMVNVSARLLKQAIRVLGAFDVLMAMFAVHFYDDAQCLRHYGTVPADQFIRGDLHRPWVRYCLDEELRNMQTLGLVEVLQDTYVTLTDLGQQRYREVRQLLTDTGFLARRTSLSRLTQFSDMENYDAVIESVSSAGAGRRQFLSQSNISRGMRVLELGCGTGALTLDAGLIHRVGDTGELVATDPSYGMLTRAKRKSERMGSTNIRLVQMRAEQLDFPDNTFDAVVGMAFLHLTDIPRALREVHRVLKPGGWFETLYPLNFPHSVPFFAAWFAPIFSLAERNAVPTDSLPEPSTVPTAMQDLFNPIGVCDDALTMRYHNPDYIVSLIVRVVNAFDAAMGELPWQARQNLIHELTVRGHEIVAQYPSQQLCLQQPIQVVRARARK